MRITRIVVLLSSLSLLLSLSACKESSKEQPGPKTPVVSVEQPEIKEDAAVEPVEELVEEPVEEEVLVDDSDVSEKTVDITDEDFGCIRDMKQVRGMYLGNLLGNIDATEAVANSEEGGVYPPGTVVQIVPTEAMVKREAGFNPSTSDWEFFVLDVSGEGTKIAVRGGEEVKTPFGQDCLSCHAQADPKWDMICESGHGCQPIPVTRDMILALQKTDQRCAPMALTETDKEALKKLGELVKALTEAAAGTPAEEASEAVEEVTDPEETDSEEEAGPVDEGKKEA